jgi:hypothetical protein
MNPIRLLVLLVCLATTAPAIAQQQPADTLSNQALEQLPANYLTKAAHHTKKYINRVNNKTLHTLTKLARWEAKIKTLLEKASPQTAQQLFNNSQLTFAAALEKYKHGQSVIDNYKTAYSGFADELHTSIKYISDSNNKKYIKDKLIKTLPRQKAALQQYDTAQANAEAMQQFIKQRKQELLQQSLQYIGNSKYLQKINKESYYYIATITNYKQLFADKQKATQTALTLLQRIPAFKRFMQQHSQLAQLFPTPAANGQANLAGLQTRASVTALIQSQIAAGGPNAAEQVRNNLQAAQAALNKLKDRVLQAGGSSGDMVLPDFKPKQVKSRTLGQRIEKGINVQFGRNNSYLPGTADIGLHIGYKLNDKSVLGVGASYRAGLGSINKISITHQGVGLRSYIDWQLKKQFYISGGFEMNHNAQFRNIQVLQQFNAWQQSGLIGLSKKIPVKTKFTKSTKLTLLYDMLAYRHVPISQPLVFRVGYNL